MSEVAMPDELVVELAQLTGYRTDVMADWVRGVNRLRSLLRLDLSRPGGRV